jgi:hypothetical protein
MSIRSRRYIRTYKRPKNLSDERGLQQRDVIAEVDSWSFFDITGQVPGTVPEKMVYNHLVRLRVNFNFQYHMPDNPGTYNPEDVWIPDFELPDCNIYIEVFGTYWHTMNRDSDQLKKAYWLMAGYTIYEGGVPTIPNGNPNGGKVVIWWDTEIYGGVARLFARDIPEVFERRIPGTVGPEIRDSEAEFRKIEAMRARLAARKREPKIHPALTRHKKLRNSIYGKKKIYGEA